MNPSPESFDRDRWIELIQQHLLGVISNDESRELESVLKASPEAREDYRQRCNVDAALRQEATAQTVMTRVAVPKAARSFSWRPLMAAAAGLVIGLFCASVVFAYVAPSSGKVVTLLDESFESEPAPLVTGVPVEPGRWSGDYSEVVGKQQGVKPESGQKMLRLLRADYEGKPNGQASRVADIYRLIDMRPYRQEFADGSAVVQLSAGFNAFVFPPGEDYRGKMTLHAFDAESVTNGALQIASARDENCLAAATAGPVRLYRNPTNWRRLTSDLRVPASTDFLLIHLTISAGRGTLPKAGFGGHYIDDVRLTLRHSPLR